MLDKIGLSKKDGDGFRLRTDNGQRLRLHILAVQAFMPWPKQMEMVVDQWKRIGISAEVKEAERNLAMSRVRNNDHHMYVWTNGGTELFYLFPRHAIPVDPTEAYMGPDYAVWYASGGKQGTKPEDPHILRIFDLFSAATGLKAPGADTERAGNVAHPGGPAIRHRHRRPVPGADGRPPGQQQAGQHRVPRVHRATLPDAGRVASGLVVLQGVNGMIADRTAD